MALLYEGDIMSEQSKILEKMQNLITEILKSGTASVEQGEKIDALEVQLFKQKSFKETPNEAEDIQGEVIANLLFNKAFKEAVDKLYDYKITPEDFFGFIGYHYDEDDNPEVELFTDEFCTQIGQAYEVRCNL